MQGGIYNASLIDASQRKARNKLNKMGGIMASSTELMQAAMPTPPAPRPMAQPMAAPAPMVQPMLPQVPMQMAVTPMAPAPVQQPVQQAAPAPQPQQQPVMMNEGGFMTVRKRTEDDKAVDVGASPVLGPVMALHGGFVFSKMMDMFGSEDKVEEEVKKKVAPIEAAIASENPENIAKTVADQAGLPATDEGVKEFASNVFGLDDVNDIDEINRRIADVAMSSAIGKGPDDFAAAVLLGLQNYKQTASARAAAAADAEGGGFLDTERGKAAVEIYTEQIKNNVPPSEVEQMMNAEMGGNIGTKVRQAITGSVSSGQQTPESLLAEARSVIERGAKRSDVEDRLREMGVDPGRL